MIIHVKIEVHMRNGYMGYVPPYHSITAMAVKEPVFLMYICIYYKMLNQY